jgi:pyrimidine-nucleoside phosphorylase
MRAVDLIRKKRDGGELSPEEISFLVRGCCTGEIPDYQVSSFLMTVFFRGMSECETVELTRQMRDSGSTIDLRDLPGLKVDKHSTGGVGDMTSLVVGPAVAAAGLIVPMISGRGLGHTGGTLDKLESIPGFNVRLGVARFKEVLAAVGIAMIGQTDDLVPADRRFYALRDVTATIDSRPLITASIMSKKLAEGIDGLVLDVKTGSGAFMKSEPEAEALAQAMVGVGRSCGKKVTALVTDMDQPLGDWVGNSLEMIEAIEVLKARGPEDTRLLCEELTAHCLVLGEASATLAAGRALYREVIRSGRALEHFREMVRAQGGNPAVVEDYSILPRARKAADVSSLEQGFVAGIDTEEIGRAAGLLGAGRATVQSQIDPAVGLHVRKKVGDRVERGEALCTVHYNDESLGREAARRVHRCYRFSPVQTARPALIRKTVA